MADVGGVVSAHRVAQVHHHCVQSVPALTLEQDTCLLVSYDRKNKKVRITYRTEHHRCGKVWRERPSRSLREVKGLREDDGAAELSSAAAAASKPFQVHAQDSRQGEHFDNLRGTSGDVLTADRSHPACVMNSVAPDWTGSLFRSLDKSSCRRHAAPGAGRRTSGRFPGMVQRGNIRRTLKG